MANAEHSVPSSEKSLDAEIRCRLDAILAPCSVAHGVAMGLDEMGLVAGAYVDADRNVAVQLRVTSPCCLMVDYFVAEAARSLEGLADVRSVDVRVDQGLDWTQDMMSDRARERRRAGLSAKRALAGCGDVLDTRAWAPHSASVTDVEDSNRDGGHTWILH